MIDISLEINPIDIDIGLENIYDVDIGFDLGTIISGGIPYEGSYEATPKIDEQILETKNRYLKDDITIFAIPYSSVSNPQGGETVNIAFE